MTAELSAPATRRALLAAGIGGLLAALAQAIGRPDAVRATHGDVHLGASNTATSTTSIENTTAFAWAFEGKGANGGVGVRAEAIGSSGTAVSAFSDEGTAVGANSNSNRAVNADSGSATEPALRARSLGFSTGVLGYSGVSGSTP